MSERIEKIIREYPQKVMECKCLEGQITKFKGVTEKEMLETLVFHQPKGERVQTSGISDKTAKVALTYKDQTSKNNYDWLEHLQRRYLRLSEELIFFESAISSLDDELSDLMMDLVKRQLNWDDLADKYLISRTSVAKRRRKAIRELEKLYEIRDRDMADYILR